MTPPAAFDSAKMQLWEHAAQGNTSSGFVVVDVDLKVRLVNNKFLELYLFDEAFVKDGTPLGELFEVRAMRGDFGGRDLSQLVAEQINNFRPLEYDQPVHSTDRTVYGLEGEVVRVRMPDAHQLVLVTDVTKRKHAERALRD